MTPPEEGADSTLLIDHRDHVRTLTLNRPRARNAVNRELARALGRALEECEHDDDVRVVVITGAGDVSFCAGADLKEASSDPRALRDELDSPWGFAGMTDHPISKPVIAAVNGLALGGGTEIVLAADLAIAVDDALLGLPEVAHGIFAGGGGVHRLPRQIPPKIALEAILTARPITARRAFELGLINAVVPRDDLAEEVLRMARTIASNAPLAVQASKRMALGIVDGALADEASRRDLARSEGARLLATSDAHEGLVAFAEKRAPLWDGR